MQQLLDVIRAGKVTALVTIPNFRSLHKRFDARFIFEAGQLCAQFPDFGVQFLELALVLDFERLLAFALVFE